MTDKPEPDLDDDETPEPTGVKTEPIASTSDLIVVAVVAILGGGFWFWYHGEGRQSRSHFAHADSLYSAHRYPEALAAYRALRESEQVVAKEDDSLLYKHIDSLSTLEDHAKNLTEGARAALLSKDTNLVRAAYRTLSDDKSGFIPDSILARLKAALEAR